MIYLKENKDYKLYGHITTDWLIYIGITAQKCYQRWQPNQYKNTALEYYIKRDGWNNIKHIVFQDGLTKEQAETFEDLLIRQATVDGWCINKQHSGGFCRDNPKEYHKQWYKEHQEEQRNYSKQYQVEHKEELKQYRQQYWQDHRDEHITYLKQRRSTPEGKIYTRVTNFNRLHPDKVIETPMEAKRKYLETGYIPNYIKNNDLISEYVS